jgi:integrase
MALLLMAHTFVRVGELVACKKSEIIEADHIWVIPEERMKPRIPHAVPLSPQVLALLKSLEPFNAGSDYVLPSPQKPNKHVNESTPLDHYCPEISFWASRNSLILLNNLVFWPEIYLNSSRDMRDTASHF